MTPIRKFLAGVLVATGFFGWVGVADAVLKSAGGWLGGAFTTAALGPDGTASLPAYSFSAEPSSGLYRSTTNKPAISAGGTTAATFQSTAFQLRSDGALGFASGTLEGSNADTQITRPAASVVQIAGISNAAAELRVAAGNGAYSGLLTVNESLTIAAAATTDSATTIPANAIITSVAVRVTTVIPTAATFTVTSATGGTVFNTAAVTVAANSTDVGTKAGFFYQSAATKVRITPNLTPGAATGVVRLAITYYLPAAPTS